MKKAFMKTGAFVLVTIIQVVIAAFVLSTIWGWLVVPTFGLPELTGPQAVGVYLVVSYMTAQNKGKHTEDEREFTDIIADSLGRSIGKALGALAIAYPLSFMI